MFPNERYDIILNKIKANNSVTVSELIEVLNVSFETVRRDLFYLEKEGKLKRVHGGAIPNASPNDFPLFNNRLTLNRKHKDILSRKAMKFISERDTIAVDSGSTSSSFATALVENFKELTVITYSKEVMDILSANEGFNIISTGGRYLSSERAFYGAVTTLTLDNLQFEKSFIFPSAISYEYGIQDFTYEIIDLQKLLMKKAHQTYVLADNTKFEKTASITLDKEVARYTLISDDELSKSVKDIYTKNGIKIV